MEEWLWPVVAFLAVAALVRLVGLVCLFAGAAPERRAPPGACVACRSLARTTGERADAPVSVLYGE